MPRPVRPVHPTSRISRIHTVGPIQFPNDHNAMQMIRHDLECIQMHVNEMHWDRIPTLLHDPSVIVQLHARFARIRNDATE